MVKGLGQRRVVFGTAQTGPLVEHHTDQLLGRQDVGPAGHTALHDASLVGGAVRVAETETVGALGYPLDVGRRGREGDQHLAVRQGVAAPASAGGSVATGAAGLIDV